ncbi:MAG: site-specific integrase [Prevotella sp.]|nr:site-specific integrase [Prevotella sp.]
MIIPQIKFVFDRKHLASNIKKGVIELRITFNRKQKFITTGVKCFPGEWDDTRESIKSLNSQEDNAMLMKIRRRALKIIGEMVDGENIDLNAIPSLIKQKDTDITFEDYIHKRMNAKQVSDYTKKAYHVFFSRFSEWGKMQYFRDITESNIRKWDEYLHTVTWEEKDRFGKKVTRKYSQASIGSMHKNLKVFINDAMVDGYVKENPYSTKRIKIDKGEARTESFLTVEEMDKIENANMPTRSLTEARDLFVFACKTGMSYADLMEFDYSKVIEIDGFKLYRSKRHKTLTSFSSVIIKSAMRILEKYKFSLPKMPNQKYNIKLKLVADAAGIDKPISSHWARRSAAMFWINEGVPLDVVSKILGHTNQKQTLEYAHILDKTIIKEIAKVVDD